MQYVWLLVLIILIVIEVATTDVVTIWFIVSALATLLLSFIIDSELALFIIFVVGGLLLLVFTKPLMKKYVKPKKVATNSDRVIGLAGFVTEEIKKDVIGEVKVDGKKWSAISDANLKVGDKVIVEKISGVKLIVRKED